MKSLLTCLAIGLSCLCPFHPLHAQQAPPAHRKGLYISGNAAVGLSKVTGGNLYDYRLTAGNKLYTGYGLGLGAMLTNHIGLFTGLRVDRFSFYYTSGRYSNGQAGKINERFIGLPFYVRLITGKRREPAFFVHAGFEVLFLNEFTDDNGYREFHDPEGFSETTAALMINCGLQAPVNDRIDISIGPDLNYQLGNIFSDPDVRGRYLSLGGRLTLSYRVRAMHPSGTASRAAAK